MLKNVLNFTVDNFSGRQGSRNKSAPAIVLENSAEGLVRNSTATEGTAAFIHVTGARTQELTLKDNRTGKAKQAVTFENDSVKKSVARDKS